MISSNVGKVPLICAIKSAGALVETAGTALDISRFGEGAPHVAFVVGAGVGGRFTIPGSAKAVRSNRIKDTEKKATNSHKEMICPAYLVNTGHTKIKWIIEGMTMRDIVKRRLLVSGPVTNLPPQ